MIGGGGIGERHLRCLKKAGFEQVGLVEPREARRAELASKYSVEHTWSKPEDADFSRFTHAVVATPPTQHLDHTRLLASHGIHVLTEKPLCASKEEADEFVKLAASAKVVIRVAFTYRSIELFRIARSRVEQGVIGSVKAFHIQVGQHFPTFRPDYMQIYWADPKQGGCSLDAMAHLVDMAFWNMGEVTWLGGLASNLGLTEALVDDSALVLLKGPRGEHVSVSANQFQAPNESRFLWVGDKGSQAAESADARLRTYKRGDSQWTVETFPSERDDGYVRQAKLFFEETQGKSNSLTTVPEAAKNLEICLRLRSTFQKA